MLALAVVMERTNPLGSFISMFRREQGWSQSELARRSQMSVAYIRQLEEGFNPSTGKPISPKMETIEKLAVATRVAPDSLWRIARGEDPKSVISSQKGHYVGTLRAVAGGKINAPVDLDFEIPEDTDYPPSDIELSQWRKLVHGHNLGDLDPTRKASWWYVDTASRKRRLRDLLSMIEEDADRESN